MDNRIALDPRCSVVVEACAGSGKTWLLVSRIVRLLLAGVAPGEILAITFTRKAAQEMQARLHEWLHLLATQDDAAVRDFLRERELHEVDAALLARARGLYRDFLLAQPSITINTFHGWFVQIIQRAPLNAGVPVGMQLLERTSALREEAWQEFADSLRAATEDELAQEMQWMFAEYGLHSTRALLDAFVDKRGEWWAYTQGQQNAVAWAVEQLRGELEVDWDADPVADACADASLQAAVQAFAQVLATGTETQRGQAGKLQAAWEQVDIDERFSALSLALYTKEDEPRSFKPTKKQNAEVFLFARDVLFGKMQAVRDALAERDALRMNQAGLRCGAALLQQYQDLKLRSQQMDFTDVEWQVCRLLNQSDCAEYMQYKLDSRYRHVLLDEFQDTNPLQWLILQAWFAAAAAVESRPTVFVVGDPKQSIYRFRRADARLFGEVREFLQQEFGAHYLMQNETRRNAPAVLQVVNGVFLQRPDGFVDFERHVAHHQNLPGYAEVLPLANLPPSDGATGETTSHMTRLSKNDSQVIGYSHSTRPLNDNGQVAGYPAGGESEARGAKPDEDEGLYEELNLRNPLTTPRAEDQGGAREIEAKQFAAQIADIVANWCIQEKDAPPRRAEYRDIMVLVRKRTHLRTYEHALRMRHIPFLTSRRGGLLDTLEAEDMQALLTFLITPFADLALAQALRAPLFACSDEDLMLISGCRVQDSGCSGGAVLPESRVPNPVSSWWQRLQHLADPSPALQRAANLLKNWLALADKLPVHDLLDRIYFEGDLAHRYAAALPAELHETVRANLQAFMEIALNVDAGRYPSLPRFLAELRELRNAGDNESPDEGKVGEVGNALRIYTVHEAKGLEAPIVWLLDANDTQRRANSYGVLLDWPSNMSRPAHFSLFPDKRGRGARRATYFTADEDYAQREEMNLLYVAMTRAKQALLVSGHGEPAETSWYSRVAQVVAQDVNPLLAAPGSLASAAAAEVAEVDASLLRPLPTGSRAARLTVAQRRGIWLHALLQHLAPTTSLPAFAGAGEITGDLPACGLSRMASSFIRGELQQRCGIPEGEMEALWQQAQQLLGLPHLQRYFDAQHYRSACNEMPYVNARGELRRIDRLVEYDTEVWVMDYKISERPDPARYRAQMQEYRAAMQAVYAGKTVRCALLFADGVLSEVE